MSTSNDTGAEVEITEDLHNLVPGLRLQPGDNQILMEELRNSLMAELNPTTAYEHIIAGNLVTLEMELIRIRQMRDLMLYKALLDHIAVLITEYQFNNLIESLRQSLGALDTIRAFSRALSPLRSHSIPTKVAGKL